MPNAEHLSKKRLALYGRFVLPGEEIQSIFGVQTGLYPNYRSMNGLVSVVVTDRSIVLVGRPRFLPALHKVLARLPRETLMGPLSGQRWSRINLPTKRPAWVSKAYASDVEAADLVARQLLHLSPSPSATEPPAGPSPA